MGKSIRKQEITPPLWDSTEGGKITKKTTKDGRYLPRHTTKKGREWGKD